MPVPSLNPGSNANIHPENPIQGMMKSDASTVVALTRMPCFTISEAILGGFGTGTVRPLPGNISQERVASEIYKRLLTSPFFTSTIEKNLELQAFLLDFLSGGLSPQIDLDATIPDFRKIDSDATIPDFRKTDSDIPFSDLQMRIGNQGKIFISHKQNLVITPQQFQQILATLKAQPNLSPELQQALSSNNVFLLTQADIDLLAQIITDISDCLANEVENEFKALESHSTTGKARTAPMPLSTLYVAIAINSLAINSLSSAERKEKRIIEKANEAERAERAEERKIDAKIDAEIKEDNFHLRLAEALRNQNYLWTLLQILDQERHTNQDLGPVPK